MSTDEADRITRDERFGVCILDRGWCGNRRKEEENQALVYRVVRLKRASDTAEEGVFTCAIGGDSSSLGIYYPCE